MSQKLVIATNNSHKVSEIAEMLPGLEVCSLSQEHINIAWEENGSTFEENALIKARAVWNEVKGVVLADDSGLMVDVLGGEPGVYSARYAGIDGDDLGNNRKLIEQLLSRTDEVEGKEVRSTGRFVCALALKMEDGSEYLFRGECLGGLIVRPRGSHGFGYDPLFVPNGFDETLAELGPIQKNKISHRSMALAKFVVSGLLKESCG